MSQTYDIVLELHINGLLIFSLVEVFAPQKGMSCDRANSHFYSGQTHLKLILQ